MGWDGGDRGHGDEVLIDTAYAPTSRTLRRDRFVAVLLVMVAAILRVPSLKADGFFRDDAWAALASRADGARELLISGSVSPGFAALIWSWSLIAGRSLLALQMPAFIAGVLLPAAVYLIARAWKRTEPSALVGAVVVLTAQWALMYSARVKVFTLDALVVVGLLALGRWVAERPRERTRWLVITVAAVSALVFSAGTAPVTVFALGVPAACAFRLGARKVAGAAVLTYGVVAAVWYLSVLRPATTDELHDFWRDAYAPIGDGPSSVVRMARLWGRFFVAAAPARASVLLGWMLAVAVLLGVLALATSRQWVTLALTGGPVLLAAGFAALSLAPFGGGRTDVYLLPCVALLVGAVLDAPPLARMRVIPALAAVGAFAVLTFASLPALKGTYPHDDLAGTVSWLQAELEPGDRVVVYPESNYQWAISTSEDISLARDERAMTAFSPRSSDVRVLLLPGYLITSTAKRTLGYRAESGRAVAALAHDATVDRIWVVRTTWIPDDIPEVSSALTDAGFEKGPTHRDHDGMAQQWNRGT